MRIFVRNRSRYNPETRDSVLIHVDVFDPTRTLINDVKESYKTVTRVHKLDELFMMTAHQALRLEDGRSVSHYNIRDGEILESCSNPFFAACMSIMHAEAVKISNENAGDDSLCRRLKDSIIHKLTILQVLYNSKKDVGVTQPNKFHTVEEFVAFVKNHHKKGMTISEISIQKLYQFWDEFHREHAGTADPIRSFVLRYRERLGFDDDYPSQIDTNDHDAGYNTSSATNDQNHGGARPKKRARRNASMDAPGFPGAGHTLGVPPAPYPPPGLPDYRDNPNTNGYGGGGGTIRPPVAGRGHIHNRPPLSGYQGYPLPRTHPGAFGVPSAAASSAHYSAAPRSLCVAGQGNGRGRYSPPQNYDYYTAPRPPVAGRGYTDPYPNPPLPNLPRNPDGPLPARNPSTTPLHTRYPTTPRTPNPLPIAGQGNTTGRLPPRPIHNVPHQPPVASRGASVTPGRSPRGRSPAQGTTPSKKRKTKNNSNRMCENCSDGSVATVYCPDCEGGMAYCAPCVQLTHQGHARAQHQPLDITQAPKTPKLYTPHAYMAPFSLLVGLYDGYRRRPPVLSMTEDELRRRAQPVTDTDLSDKNTGKMFGGFDSMESLITKQLVSKEATENPTFALTNSGRVLAGKLLTFHNEMFHFLGTHKIPHVPPLQRAENFLVGTRQVALVVDNREKQRGRLNTIAASHGLPILERELPVGDYVFILLPPGIDVASYTGIPDLEQVLPHIVERKSWDDLKESLSTNRFRRQIENIKRCGLRDQFYLVEGDIRAMRDKPNAEKQAQYYNNLKGVFLEDDFHVAYTGSWMKSAQWLMRLGYVAARQLTEAGISSKPLITYRDFCKKTRGEIVAPDHVPYGRRQICHVLKADSFIETLFRGVRTGAQLECVKEELGIYSPKVSNKERHLLIIQGLGDYNKSRSKVLNDCLAAIVNEAENKSSRDIAMDHFKRGIMKLVHYDVQSYIATLLQIYVGVYVHRTETDQETTNLRQDFLSSGDNPMDIRTLLQTGVHDDGHTLGNNFGPPSDHDDDDDDNRGGPPGGGGVVSTFAGDDFANNSQDEEEQLRRVLEASRNDSSRSSESPAATRGINMRLPDGAQPVTSTNDAASEDRELQAAIALSLETLTNPSRDPLSGQPSAIHANDTDLGHGQTTVSTQSRLNQPDNAIKVKTEPEAAASFNRSVAQIDPATVKIEHQPPEVDTTIDLSNQAQSIVEPSNVASESNTVEETTQLARQTQIDHAYTQVNLAVVKFEVVSDESIPIESCHPTEKCAGTQRKESIPQSSARVEVNRRGDTQSPHPADEVGRPTSVSDAAATYDGSQSLFDEDRNSADMGNHGDARVGTESNDDVITLDDSQESLPPVPWESSRPIVISPVGDNDGSGSDGHDSTFDTSIVGLNLDQDFLEEQRQLLNSVKKEQSGSSTGSAHASAAQAYANVARDLELARRLQFSLNQEDEAMADDDEVLARKLQWNFDNEAQLIVPPPKVGRTDSDAELARKLAAEWAAENGEEYVSSTSASSGTLPIQDKLATPRSKAQVRKGAAHPVDSPSKSDRNNNLRTPQLTPGPPTSRLKSSAHASRKQLDEYRHVQNDRFRNSHDGSASHTPRVGKTPTKCNSNRRHIPAAAGSSRDLHHQQTPQTSSQTSTTITARFSGIHTGALALSDNENHHSISSETEDIPSACPSASQAAVSEKTNVTCGSCKQTGHNRNWKKCPNYYNDDEMRRRNEVTDRKKQREVAKKAEKQQQIDALQQARDNVQARHEEIARALQDQVSTYDEAIGVLRHPRGGNRGQGDRGGRRGRRPRT